MIVKKPIGPVKIAGTLRRLTVGQPVPDDILKYWQEGKVLEGLIKCGAVENSSRVNKKQNEEKNEKADDSNNSVGVYPTADAGNCAGDK